MESLKQAVISGSPMLITPRKAVAHLERCASFDPTKITAASDIESMMELVFGRKPALVKAGAIAVIPVHGVIGHGLTALESMMGSHDLNDLAAMIEDVESDPVIERVIFNFNSPGGTVTGVPEAAARIRNMSKHTIGFTDSQSCSASMWLMSQCKEVYATASSTVGSIGVYIPVYDESKAYDDMGVSVDLISSGWAKGAGFPGTKMTKEQRALLKEEVVECHQWFKNDIKAMRKGAKDEDMEGQCWSGAKAAEKGLISATVSDFDELITAVSWEQYYASDRVVGQVLAMEPGEELGDDDESDEKKKQKKPDEKDTEGAPAIEAKE